MKNILNKIFKNSQKGFTLIEILIAIALLGILSAIVIPNVTGYLSKGESQAYKSDVAAVQVAVDDFYSDPTNRGTTGANKGKKLYPLQGTEAEKVSGGIPVGTATEWTTGEGFFIDFSKIAGAGKTLKEIPNSASSDNTGTGSYTYYVTTAGKVESKWIGDRTTIGFKSGVYP